jgi:nicotinamidase-related amidase
MEEKKTLVIVDLQWDFIGGSLAVDGAEEAVKNIIGKLMTDETIGEVIFTADWHPSNHCSFKENGGQWPSHCVQYTIGAGIDTSVIETCHKRQIPYQVFLKGMDYDNEEYGAFINILDHVTDGVFTGSNFYGTSKADFGYSKVEVCGIAGDYCVLQTLRNLMKSHKITDLSVFTDGIVSIDGGDTLETFIKDNNIKRV